MDSVSTYMPMVAATKGTLSMMADAMPMTVAMISWLGMLSLRTSAKDRRMPAKRLVVRNEGEKQENRGG